MFTFDHIQQEIINNLGSFCLIKVSKEGILETWNDTAQFLYGYTKDEILDQHYSLLFPEFDLDLNSPPQNQVETWAKTRENNQINVVISVNSVVCNMGIEQFFLLSKDITLQKLMSQELKSYKDAITNSSLCLAELDAEGKITSLNGNFLKKYKYDRNEIIGRHFSFSNLSSYDEAHMWETLHSGKVYEGEFMEQSKFGEPFWMNKAITPIQLENKLPHKYLVVSYDITEKKYGEEENKKKILMERSLKMKDEFLANMSHEIRTPLNVVLGYADLLLESEMSNEQFKQIATIKKSGKLLLSIINDILDLSKLESGKLTLDSSPFKLTHLLYSVKDMLEIQTAKKELDFSLKIAQDVPEVVIGDQTRIEQILVNLINNAIKFTRIGFVKVHADVINRQNEMVYVRIKVIDSGIGIPKDKIDTIFESFTQTSKYITREFGGTGLGLTIVKKLITQLKGSIEVESVVNKGSVFTITIPFLTKEKDEIREFIPPIETKSDVRKVKENLDLKILLVEDNEYNQLLAQTRLSSWNCQVDTAGNGLEALEFLRKNHYHLILMDIQMPIMSGYDATQRIRNEFEGAKADIPIIALTAHASNTSAIEAKKNGFDDYLYKPFNSDLLYSKIKIYGNRFKSILAKNQNWQKDPTKDLVDFTYIENEALGHQDIIRMLIEAFLKEFEIFLRDSQKAIQNKDWNGVYKAVHRIGPSVNNFNLKTIKQHTKTLYDKSKNEEDVDSYGEIIDKIKTEFVHVKPIFENKIQRYSHATSSHA